jgi:hypothetical protein
MSSVVWQVLIAMAATAFDKVRIVQDASSSSSLLLLPLLLLTG